MIPGKILLFGEHILLKGAEALVIPSTRYGGEWKAGGHLPNISALQMNLSEFALYLQKGDLSQYFDSQAFSKDLAAGLYFVSDIPTGYGAGSSGAVTAAVYRRYGLQKQTAKALPAADYLSFLKSLFARAESFFHGTSSGIDPLICYVNRPIYLGADKQLKTVTVNPLTDYQLFLLDTGIRRKTEPFVKIFLNKWENPSYADKLTEDLFPLNHTCIQAYITGNGDELSQSFAAVSELQYEYFSEMIPADFRQIWQQGLNGGEYKLKLCGAGGGGFFLGITADFARLKANLSPYAIHKI